MPKKYTLTEEQFLTLTSCATQVVNALHRDMKHCVNNEAYDVARMYEREVNEINDVLLSINAKFKTNF